ncbi:GTP-binding protein [Streptomyces sp. BI20]|uniref:GTP-binding protein n=1 Tax=Streptomyces sp. BI20 TaxID=3403460 RepID=UPI003C76A64A
MKILVAGGFGAGKTTLVGSVSEIPPLSTEEVLSCASAEEDPLDGIERKATTTVALDFGRITLSVPRTADPTGSLVLYLFGTPGQQRFWFLWEELCAGALGAIVVADTRRLADCFPAVDFFEKREIPFLIAVNEFEDAHRYGIDEIRGALDLDPGIPVVTCDARRAGSATATLVALVRHLLTLPATVHDPRGEPP